jgi:hypothetical protein
MWETNNEDDITLIFVVHSSPFICASLGRMEMRSGERLRPQCHFLLPQIDHSQALQETEIP